MVNIQQIKLLDMVPPSIRTDEQVKAAAEALEAELQAVTQAIKETLIVSNIDTLPEKVLDLIAWQLHIDFYEPETMSIQRKRGLIKKAIAWHKRKGTPAVVQEIVSTVFDDGVTREWWEYGGEPYKFRVECTDMIQDGATFQRLIDLVNIVKNVRSHLEAIRVKREQYAYTLIGACQCSGKTVTIGHKSYELDSVTSNLLVGHACRVASYIAIRPAEV